MKPGAWGPALTCLALLVTPLVVTGADWVTWLFVFVVAGFVVIGGFVFGAEWS